MTGAVVSTTVMIVWAMLLFPEASVTVNVTVMLPNGKTGGATLVTSGEASQTSLEVGRTNPTAVPARFACSTVTGAGTVAVSITGAVVSITVTNT